MELDTVLLTVSVVATAQSLVYAAWQWFRSRNANKITVRVGDDVVELDSDDPEDAEEILDLAVKQREQVEILPTQAHARG